MAHLTGADVTSGSTPEVHAGLSYKHATYTLSETVSGSLTISLCNLPGGARVQDVTLGLNNTNIYDTTTAGAGIAVHVKTGGNVEATIIQTGSANQVLKVFNPTFASIGHRATSSSQVVFQIANGAAGSGTTSTEISMIIAYDCQEDPD